MIALVLMILILKNNGENRLTFNRNKTHIKITSDEHHGVPNDKPLERLLKRLSDQI